MGLSRSSCGLGVEWLCLDIIIMERFWNLPLLGSEVEVLQFSLDIFSPLLSCLSFLSVVLVVLHLPHIVIWFPFFSFLLQAPTKKIQGREGALG